MRIEGVIDGQNIVITFDTDGTDFFDVSVIIGDVLFDWWQLSSIQQEQIKKQIQNSLNG